MRPTYETTVNLQTETAVAAQLQQLWECRFVKTPKFYEFDYAIESEDEVKAFCEIKVRGKHYPTLLLSLHKWQQGLMTAENTGLPFLLIAKTPEGIFWHQITKKPYRIVVGGRKDRGDEQDIEPCVLIPFDDMTKVKEQ
jgi:hypothetical protein